MDTLNIYIIHYEKLSYRNDNITRLKNCVEKNDIATLKINIHIITDHNPEEINLNNIKNLVNLSEFEDKTYFYQQLLRNISIPCISNILKHFKAIQLSSKSANAYNLIIEDDIEFSDKIIPQINSLLSNLKIRDDWDVVFLGQPSDVNVINQQNSVTLNEINRNELILPCVDSYLFTAISTDASL